MPENWNTYKLGEVAALRKKTVRPKDFNGEKYIGLEHIGQGDFLLNGIGISSDVTSNKFKFKSGDILYGKIRPYFKKVYKPTFSGICSTDILIIKSTSEDVVTQEYLYQLIKTQTFTDKAVETSSGTKMPRADWKSLEQVEFPFPPIEQQKSIASILSALDDKIELNLQTNKTLEEMALALYRHWFVDFGPYQDGEFVESELGEIPKGWEVKQLKDFALLIMGQSPKSEFYNDNKEGLPFHQGVKDYGIRFPTDITYSTAGNRQAAKGDILISVRAPVGRLNVAKNKIILGRGLAAIRMPKFNSFLFYALKRMFTTEDSIGSGTVFNSVNKSDLQNLKFVLPSENQLFDFTNLVNPLDQQYLNNSKENQTLTELRDTLLPKLINGEVRVKEVEKTLSEVL